MLEVSRVSYLEPTLVGTIDEGALTFTYDATYLDSGDALPLSLSLPLRSEPYPAAAWRPYFEGLLAEGSARERLAAELQLPEDDWLGLLAACARDCIGDVLIRHPGGREEAEDARYDPISPDELGAILGSAPSTASSNARRRLSLAGAQSKTGLAHDPSRALDDGWLMPSGLAATTHILKTSYLRDVPEIEFVCMKAARACGIRTAEVGLLGLGTPALAVERFDRSVRLVGGNLRVRRVHQEDMAQAFTITPASKYVELEGGSIASMARLIRERCARPAAGLRQLALVVCFSYLIGNCDAHLKNFSLTYQESPDGCDLSLSPAYDLVCTTCYERFSRNMAMRLGGVRQIDDVGPETFEELAHELGVTRTALRRACRGLMELAEPSVMAAGSGEMGPVLDSTEFVAEDLVEDMRPRLAVLRQFCG